MFQVQVKTCEGIKSVKDYTKIPKKFGEKSDYTIDEVDELLTYIKNKGFSKPAVNDTIIVKEDNCVTKFVGKWKTHVVGGYGYGAIVNVLNIVAI
tara:strand:- start:673 stop:957 length:285 start_codon:yes stop_codon:yes gene_type:complete